MPAGTERTATGKQNRSLTKVRRKAGGKTAAPRSSSSRTVARFHLRLPARCARRPTRDTSRVGTGRESGTLGDPRAPHVAAGESRRDRRGTPAPPTPLCETWPARRRLAASPLRRHPPIERYAPGAYPACRAGFASRGTAVARGIVPSRSRLAPTRDMSLGSLLAQAAPVVSRESSDAPPPQLRAT